MIHTAADHTIPLVKIKVNKRQVPCWNEQCTTATKEAKHAFNRYKKHKTLVNKIEHNKNKAVAKRVYKDAKQNFWLKFVSTLNVNTPPTLIWKKIQRIQGKFKSTNVKRHIKQNNIIFSDPYEIANELFETFDKNSSNKNYSQEFLEFKEKSTPFSDTDNREFNSIENSYLKNLRN